MNYNKIMKIFLSLIAGFLFTIQLSSQAMVKGSGIRYYQGYTIATYPTATAPDITVGTEFAYFIDLNIVCKWDRTNNIWVPTDNVLVQSGIPTHTPGTGDPLNYTDKSTGDLYRWNGVEWVLITGGAGDVTQAQLDDSTAAVRADFPDISGLATQAALVDTAAAIRGDFPSSGGSSTFTGLTDSPSSYSGQANKMLLVNPGETALIFADTAGLGGGTGLTNNTSTNFLPQWDGDSLEDSPLSIIGSTDTLNVDSTSRVRFNIQDLFSLPTYNHTTLRHKTPGGVTRFYLMPNGNPVSSTSLASGIKMFATDYSLDDVNYHDFGIYTTNEAMILNSKRNGTYANNLPFSFRYQDSNEILRLQSKANAGLYLGTPSADVKNWTTFHPIIAGQAAAFVGRSANTMDLFQNAYYDGSFKRVLTGYSTRHTFNTSGEWELQAGGTGSAGGTITWTTNMKAFQDGKVDMIKAASVATGLNQTVQVISNYAAGEMTDGFGTKLEIAVQDVAATKNILGGLFAQRENADNTGFVGFLGNNSAASKFGIDEYLTPFVGYVDRTYSDQWNTFDPIRIGSTVALSGRPGGTNTLDLTQNAYYNSGWKRIVTGYSIRYGHDTNGNVTISSGGTGSADAAITWTERHRFEEDGDFAHGNFQFNSTQDTTGLDGYVAMYDSPSGKIELSSLLGMGGIYEGSGTIPTNTVATLTDNLTVIGAIGGTAQSRAVFNSTTAAGGTILEDRNPATPTEAATLTLNWDGTSTLTTDDQQLTISTGTALSQFNASTFNFEPTLENNMFRIRRPGISGDYTVFKGDNGSGGGIQLMYENDSGSPFTGRIALDMTGEDLRVGDGFTNFHIDTDSEHTGGRSSEKILVKDTTTNEVRLMELPENAFMSVLGGSTSFTSGTPEKIDGDTPGTTTDVSSTSLLSVASSRITYTGAEPRMFQIIGVISSSTATSSNMTYFVAKNGSTIGTGKARDHGNTDIGNVTVQWVVELDTNDYVEIFVDAVANETVNVDTYNITARSWR